MKHITTLIFAFSLSLFLQACGGGGGGGTADNTTDNILTLAKLSSVKILDADRQPATQAYLALATSVSSQKVLSAVSPSALQADSNGVVDLPDLDPGTYTITVTSDDELVDSVIKLKISNENQNSLIEIMAPLAKDASGVWSNISNTSIIATISGTITDGTNPISNAEVSISGGAATNGAVTKVFTDSAGQFNLNINVSKSLTAAMLNSSIIIRAAGFNTHTLSGFQVLNGTAVSGLNFILSASGSSVANTLFHETFETDSSTLNSWAINKLLGDNPDNTWSIYTTGDNIINQAFTDGFVQLAPNDTSAGQLLDPVDGVNAFWYGSPSVANGTTITGSVQGNFLDNQASFPTLLDGGTSTLNNSGELISPQIDLSAVPSSTPVSLTFQTWWEIESVNPNTSGFDLMTVLLSTDGGSTFNPVARLNPLSDPVSTVPNDPIPFSNTGYNNAPAWTLQENIPLEGVQGQVIQLKFLFETVDGLFNGFRGWMIDDVRVQDIAGTAPLFNESFGSTGFDDAYVYLAYDDTSFQPELTPLPYDASGFLQPLQVGSQQNISATLNYSSSTAGTMKLVFRVYDFTDFSTTSFGDGTTIAETSFVASIGESPITLTGSATVPASTDGFVEVWVQMFDNTGNLIVEMPIESYEVQ